MLYLIIGLVACVLYIVFYYKRHVVIEKIFTVNNIMTGVVLGGIAYAFSAILGFFICITVFNFNELPIETFQLAKIENTYYVNSIENYNDYISVCMLQDDKEYFKFEKFDKKFVSFKYGKNAEISIIKEKLNLSEKLSFWLGKDIVEETERIKSVTITIPDESFKETKTENSEICTKCNCINCNE